MELKDHEFFRSLTLAELSYKKLKLWGLAGANRSHFYNALKQAHPFVFDRKVTIEKLTEGFYNPQAEIKPLAGHPLELTSKNETAKYQRQLASRKKEFYSVEDVENKDYKINPTDIVENFSLPFKTVLYLTTLPPLISKRVDADIMSLRIDGYLIHEITPEKFKAFNISASFLNHDLSKDIPIIEEFDIDLSKMRNTDWTNIEKIHDTKIKETVIGKAGTSSYYENLISIMLFTKSISVKRIGIEKFKPFSIKTKGVGSDFTVVKSDRLYHIADKVEYKYTTKDYDPESRINWDYSGWRRGHWRAFYVKDSSGNNIKNSFGRNTVDYGRMGKNRQGERNVIGYTWVIDYVVGDPKLAKIKTHKVVKGNPEMKQKTIMLPLWMKREAQAHAREVCRQKGVKANPGSKPFDKAVYDFCYDAYAHSLTTPNKLKGNPYSPSLPASVYDAFPEFFDPKRAKIVEGLEGDAAKKKGIERVKSSVVNLTMMFMKSVMGLSNEAFGFGKAMSEDQQKKVILNQYRRMYVAIKILSRGVSQLNDSRDQIISEVGALGVNQDSNIDAIRGKGSRAKFVEKALQSLK